EPDRHRTDHSPGCGLWHVPIHVLGTAARYPEFAEPLCRFHQHRQRHRRRHRQERQIPKAMRTFIFIALLLLTGISKSGYAQLNVELLHQLVQHSKDEYERQTTARNRQAIASANEEVNRSKMDALKQK